jgi:hypothetical protein
MPIISARPDEFPVVASLRFRPTSPGSDSRRLLRAKAIIFSATARYNQSMSGETVEIPKQVLASVETLDELYDWLTVHHAGIMAELREARQEDLDGKFKPWKPRQVSCPTESRH